MLNIETEFYHLNPEKLSILYATENFSILFHFWMAETDMIVIWNIVQNHWVISPVWLIGVPIEGFYLARGIVWPPNLCPKLLLRSDLEQETL